MKIRQLVVRRMCIQSPGTCESALTVPGFFLTVKYAILPFMNRRHEQNSKAENGELSLRMLFFPS